MRVLFLLNRYPGIGGIENITSLLARYFKYELGHDIAIFSIVSQSNKNDELDEIPVTIVGTDDKAIVSDTFHEYIKFFRPDIVIFQDSYAEIEYLFKNLDRSVKLYTVEHNTPDCLLKAYVEHWRHHKWFQIRGLVRKIIFPFVYIKLWFHQKKRHTYLVDRSDKYILLSDSFKHILRKYYRICNDSIIAIPNIKNDFGIRLEDIYKSLNKKEKCVVFVGRLTTQKGLDRLLDVWHEIEQINDEYTLKIVGDGEERESLISRIENLGLKRVRLMGYSDNVQDYYRRSSMLFMTSIYEGFGLVLMEAMQFGVIPFVYDTFLSLHDQVIDGENGFIISPFDKSRFVELFCRFIDIDEDAEFKMRCAAVRKSQEFSKHQILKLWSNILQ